MKPRGIDKKLNEALRRLGRVSPGTVESARERVRHNLKSGVGAGKFLQSVRDASPPSLWPVRWPILVASLTALLVVVGTIGGVHHAAIARSVSPRPVSASAETNNREAIKTAPPQPERPAITVLPARRVPTAPTPAANLGPAPFVPQQPSPQPSRFALLPPGAGKLILDRACSGCHRAGAVGSQRFATKTEYANLVSRMVAKGAPLSAPEADTLIDYLFDNLATHDSPATVTAGKAILERACTTCHSLNGIEKYTYNSEDAYRELVSGMVSYGATLTDEETNTLVRYLFTTYGKQ